MRVPRLKPQPENDSPGTAQAAIEYVLLLAAVVVVVLIAFKQLLPVNDRAANDYFNRISFGIMGNYTGCYTDEGVIWYKARTFKTNYP